MKPMRSEPQEGQSLVLVALMAIVLVAFVGLAIDGGNAYAQRRVAQNAADGGSIYGAQLAADEQWQGDPDTSARNAQMLRFIHRVVEVHGVPDSNGVAEDAINTNVVAYYTNRSGVPYTSCTIDACSSIPNDALGVEVHVSLPFATYFAGVIGWNEITVQARAIGLARVGANGFNNSKWAVFGIDGQGCGGTGSYEVDLRGAFTNKVRGNTHSNNSMYFIGPEHQGGNNVRLTVVPPGYLEPGGLYTALPSAEIGLALPDFEDYYTLAQQQASSGNGQQHTNLPTPPGYSRPTYVTGPTVTSLGWNELGGAPYTWVNGDLVITGTNATTTFWLGGLIVVNGNVTIQAPQVRGRSAGFSIFATGSIRIASSTTTFNGKAYEDSNHVYDPLLWNQTNVTSLFSNADFSESGGDSCVDPALEFLGRYTLTGSVIAPKGRAILNNGGGTKLINGALIADTISLSSTSANTLLWYNPAYFPPQPDFVELME